MVRTRVAANDNPQLRPEGATTNFASITDARLALLYDRPTYSLQVAPQTRISRYTSDDLLDTEDYFIYVSADKRYERGRIGLDFNFDRENTLTAELTESGRLLSNVDRTTLSFAPDATWFADERLSLEVGGGITDVSFGENRSSGFTDYTYDFVSASVSYQTTPTTALSLTGMASIFENPNLAGRPNAPDLSRKTTSYAYQVGLTHAFDPTLRAMIRVGQNRGTIESRRLRRQIVFPPLRIVEQIVTLESRSSGPLTNIIVEKAFERVDVAIGWDRQFNPSSQGSRQKRQQVTGSVDYRHSEQLRFLGDFSYWNQELEVPGLGNSAQALDVILFQGRAEFELDPDWLLELSYRYIRQHNPGLDTLAESNELYLALRYQHWFLD